MGLFQIRKRSIHEGCKVLGEINWKVEGGGEYKPFLNNAKDIQGLKICRSQNIPQHRNTTLLAQSSQFYAAELFGPTLQISSDLMTFNYNLITCKQELLGLYIWISVFQGVK